MNEEEKAMNSVNETVHGACLSSEDVDQLKLLVYEFSRSCLLPYVEKQIATLSDVISNKKGMSKSLFSATKRWFSPNKPGASSVAVNNLIYPIDSTELQIRKLGDLYFMFGNYLSAFQAYHLAKRDYNTDQAWLYYAGALEMAALSSFMANEPNRKSADYMEESILTYLNTCKMPQFATRATILSSECLKEQTLFGEAAFQLIRMTSEESDLRSALLLEQAAYCFLDSKMVRKYAFHMVLAGHRFSKAAHRKHSLMCYKQAYQIYENTGWNLASDHIHYTIGRLANNLQQFDEAIDYFSKLLEGESKQSAQQQAMFLKEYLTILGNKLKSTNEENTLPILPVPILHLNSLKVLVGPTRPLSTPGKVHALGINFNSIDDTATESKWQKLEEMLIQEAQDSLPIVFKPSITLYTVKKLDKNKPIAIVNETIQIMFKLSNSLQTLLHLKDTYLLWSFSNKEETISNETQDESLNSFVKTYMTKTYMIDGNSYQHVILTAIPLQTGTITIKGVCYTLTGSSGTNESSSIKGKQVIEIPPSKSEKVLVNGEVASKGLEITVVPPAPCLQVTFSEINLDFLSDEVQKVTIDFQNTSSVPLNNIYMATSVPRLLCNCEIKETPVNYESINTPALKEKIMRKNHLMRVPLPDGVLEPGQLCTFNVWIKAPNTKGTTDIDLLIYYENCNKKGNPKYRLIRHSWTLSLQESLAVDVSTQASYNSKTVEELALAMKITNLNKPHNSLSTEVMLLNVGLLSKNWTLTKDIVTPKYINLLSQESAHILLKAKRVVRSTSEYSNIPLSTDKKSIQSLMNTYLAFARKVEKPHITMFDDLDSFSFKENKDGVLILQWQAIVNEATKKRVVNGQCHIPIEVTRKEEDVIQMERILSDTVIDINNKAISEDDTNQNAQKQVSFNVAHPAMVKHNFTKDKLCIVPVKLLLHSITDNNVLSVAINTTDPSKKPATINKSNLSSPCASSTFSWLGNGKVLKVLHPLMTDTVNLAVVLTRPGTFDLGAHIQVLCRKYDQSEPYILQSCQIHSSLIVVDHS
ncbi:unnamed protein product [Acanthoscelides obtectus]|nr:unnamed protein product [Acanthoscelides obtectus]CAK1628513.1 Trafficking protein particle complex subunit 8 [Acanthoscelides obtectus]